MTLCNYPEEKATAFVEWVKSFGVNEIQLTVVDLSSPTHFGDIYRAVVECIQISEPDGGHYSQRVFHLSPGTPAMAAVWILVAKTRFAATLIESSKQQGVKVAEVPFDISAEYLPNVREESDRQVRDLSGEYSPHSPGFESVAYRSSVMERVVEKARRIAIRNVPVLIEGESGTGKELFARAIHLESSRRGNLVAVNSGAIPKELFESVFFGHKKGSFTGADKDRLGHFQAAHGGTLFLDEVGELPLEQQVKLLRTLQTSEVTRLGDSEPKAVDVRIIAATNRSLINEVQSGRFREDLFYRLAVGVLRLPPLRDRAGDLSLLIEKLMAEINDRLAATPDWQARILSPSARNVFLKYHWPGNVRQLFNGLMRAAVWSDGAAITADDAQDAIVDAVSGDDNQILNRQIGGEFQLSDLVAEVERHYVERALRETAGNKAEAARRLGFNNSQTFANKARRLTVDN